MPPPTVGAPTKYDPRFCSIAKALCKLGAIDVEIADALEIGVTTLYAWKVKYPEFNKALRAGKAVADARVVDSLYRLATGYTFDSEKILTSNGEVFREAFVEHIPPNFAAVRFWLKNRDGASWRDSDRVSASDDKLTDEEIRADAPVMSPDEPGPSKPIL